MRNVQTEKLKFEPDKFLDLIIDELKMPTISPRQDTTASLINYLLVGLKESTTAEVSPTRTRSRLNQEAKLL